MPNWINFAAASPASRPARLLESGSLRLAQITERVGYLDVATFSTLFKRLAGQSPAQYRRSFKTRAAAAVISS